MGDLKKKYMYFSKKNSLITFLHDYSSFNATRVYQLQNV